MKQYVVQMEDLFKCHQFDFVYLCFPLRDSRRQRSILLCVWRKKALWHLWISFVRTGQTLICSMFYLLCMDSLVFALVQFYAIYQIYTFILQ